jgi:chemotaxis protein methyltransferase CheR
MAFTFFFRDRQILEAVREHALPVLRGKRYIRIWDAGCAVGAEPYSLAIVLRENMGTMLFRNVTIEATDIDTSDLFADTIEQGRYHREQLTSVPGEILGRYFQAEDSTGYYRIVPEIRKAVRFHKHDLLSLEPLRDDFNLVLCKNVLLHFRHEQRIEVLRMFHSVLRDPGFLAMEQTQKLPGEVSDLFEPLASNAQIFAKRA